MSDIHTGVGDAIRPPVRAGAIGIVDRLIFGLGVAAGLLAACMMAVTVTDVVGRNVFNAPLFGAFELTELSMVAIVFLALPFVTWTREHLVVTIFYSRFPAPLQTAVTALGELVFAVLCGLIAWRAWLYADRLFRVRETTLELAMPRGYVPAGVAIALALTALLFLLLALRTVLRGERAAA